jgi:murein DD-endopeptidase MepM/ murein hydrolase activator NlpD
MYNGEHFEKEQRTVHIGIDIAAPIGCPVYAFAEGIIFKQGYNALPWDYGATIVTKHIVDGKPLFALHGHLSRSSLLRREEGEEFKQGDVIAQIGDKTENGGWNPHLHFQLSTKQPTEADMPGVVSLANRKHALQLFPDPQLVLGKLYD